MRVLVDPVEVFITDEANKSASVSTSSSGASAISDGGLLAESSRSISDTEKLNQLKEMLQ